MGSTMVLSQVIYSYLLLGFILYELLKLCGVNQPNALAMIFIYGMLFMFLIERLVQKNAFQKLFGCIIIPYYIVVLMVLLALFILYLQGEIGTTALVVISSLVLLLAFQAIKEMNSYRRSGKQIISPE